MNFREWLAAIQRRRSTSPEVYVVSKDDLENLERNHRLIAHALAKGGRIQVMVIDGEIDAVIDESTFAAGGHTITLPARDLAAIVTDIWRLRQRVDQILTQSESDEYQRIARATDHLWETMTHTGMQIQDHTGERYIEGTSLRVLAFQPSPDVHSDIIAETLRPSIYYREALVQIGEVIVHTPETPGQ